MRYEATIKNQALTMVMAGDGGVFLRRNLGKGITGVVFVF
jgi:hypothetical protein